MEFSFTARLSIVWGSGRNEHSRCFQTCTLRNKVFEIFRRASVYVSAVSGFEKMTLEIKLACLRSKQLITQ